jgi:hypothetical protein
MQSLHDRSCYLRISRPQEGWWRFLARAGRTWLLMGLALGLLSGCGGSDTLTPPSYSPERMAQDAMADYDTNHDGFLDAKELERCPALKGGLVAIDQNGDHRLSTDEIAARIRTYAESQVALEHVSCRLLLDGHPLQGATVTYVPEKFMGSSLRSATGVSNSQGGVGLITQGEKLPGVQPGFYRVQVSKKDAGGKETIPARYNQDTILGIEVSTRKKIRNMKKAALSDEEAGLFRLSSKSK